MTSILDGLKGHLTSALLEQVSGSLGESQSGISSALNGLLPTILGGMVSKAESDAGLGQIFDMISSNGNESLLDNLGSLINQGNLAHNDPKDHAGHMMGALFGDKVGSILSLITSIAGLKNSSTASSLLGLAGPLVMSFLKKKIVGNGMNAIGLTSLLMDQKDEIFGAMPSSIKDDLGFAATASDAAATASSGGGILKWLLPLLLIGAAAMYFLRGCDAQETMADATETVSDAAGAVGDAVGDAASDAADVVSDATNNAVDAVASLFKRTLPGGVEIQGNPNGIEAQLLDFVDGSQPVDKTTWFNFDALTFQTGSADLDMEKSEAQINNLVAILNAYDKLNLKIGGYTDSDGDDQLNMKLSQDRADTVMKAIMANGVDAGRLAAEGYGEAHPVCPTNDTPECKAQNRRIAVRVTAK